MNMPDYSSIYSDPAKAAFAEKIWLQTTAFLIENNQDTCSMLALADRYARARTEYEALYPAASEEGPVKSGPNGGDVPSLVWAAVDRLNDRLTKMEDALLRVPKPGSIKPKSNAPADEFLS